MPFVVGAAGGRLTTGAFNDQLRADGYWVFAAGSSRRRPRRRTPRGMPAVPTYG
jgi:hypothetical protein